MARAQTPWQLLPALEKDRIKRDVKTKRKLLAISISFIEISLHCLAISLLSHSWPTPVAAVVQYLLKWVLKDAGVVEAAPKPTWHWPQPIEDIHKITWITQNFNFGSPHFFKGSHRYSDSDSYSFHTLYSHSIFTLYIHTLLGLFESLPARLAWPCKFWSGAASMHLSVRGVEMLSVAKAQSILEISCQTQPRHWRKSLVKLESLA